MNRLFHFLLMLCCCLPMAAAEPLTTLDYRLEGQVMEVSPAALAVPKGIAGSVAITIPGEVPAGAFVEATLRGPSFPARRLVGAPNRPLLLPPLPLTGDYSLDGIRLLAADGALLLEGSPSRVPVTVFEEVLISRVTSRPLTLEEIQGRGIVIDESNFRAIEFEVGFVLDGQTFPVRFPVVAPQFKQTTEIIPAAELEDRRIRLEQLNQELIEGVKLPPELETAAPNIQVQAVNFQRVRGGAENLALPIPPIPALMVIPGNVGFLNQFFSVQIFTENGAPLNSGLSVRDITAELVLPAGPDRVAGTYQLPGDDPLRFARTGPDAVITTVVPVRNAGGDGVPGTPDDIARLQPRQTGQGEFLVEGLQEGLHVMDLKLKAMLDGLAAGPVEVEGVAAGSVLVSNPKFSLAFSHPRTVRAGEPYDAYVTVLNTSAAVANLTSITLNALNVSGGILQSPERVELGTIRPGETATATFRVLAQRTGSISFSNITTSDDSLVGRFRLRIGVDERGVALNPNTLVLPDLVDSLPPEVLAAANRVLGQALSAGTAAQLPPGVLRVPKSFVGTTTTIDSEGRTVRSGGGSMLQQLAEAGQRVRYGEPLARVLPDLLLDWQGGRNFSPGWDQIIRTTDAGREWREALMRAIENAGGDDATARLLARGVDLAGRGEDWTLGAVSRGVFQGESADGTFTLTHASGQATIPGGTLPKAPGYGGRAGAWMAAAQSGVMEWRNTSALPGDTKFAVLQTSADGSGRHVLWTVSDLPAGACVRFDGGDTSTSLAVDENCDGVAERTVAGQQTNFIEAPPAAVVVRQDPFLLVGRPAVSCYNPTTADEFGVQRAIRNYANVVAVLFNKPMSQETAGDPAAYTLDGGNRAATVQVQPGGRVALLTLRQSIGGALTPPSLTLGSRITDLRGNAAASVAVPVQRLVPEGLAVRGRVVRPDGSPGTNLPVTLTYNDAAPSSRGCVPVDRRVSQVFTNEQGDFAFPFVVSGIPISLSTTDIGAVRDNEAIALILESGVDGAVTAERLAALGVSTAGENEIGSAALRRAFGVASIGEAIALAEGLDRAVVRDFPPQSRIGGEGVYVLRFRGRAVVEGRVLAADGVSPVAGAAVNLFPDPASRELGRGIFTDGQGRFAFLGVPVGLTSLTAADNAGRQRTVSTLVENAGSTVTVDIVMGATPQPVASLQGRVTEPDGTPHDGATVMVEFRPPENSGFAAGVVAVTTADDEGYYEIARVPAAVGTLRVTAISRDNRRKGERSGIVVAADSVNVINLALQARARVSGRVEFANGDPVPGAIVGGGEALVTADEFGRFTLEGVPTGPGGSVSAGLPADPDNTDPRRQIARVGSQSLSVVPGDGNFAVIRFAPAGRIVGQLLDEAGNAVPRTNVALPLDPGTDEESGFLWVTSDATGAFVFESVPLRSWTLSAPAPPVEDVEGTIDNAISQIRSGDMEQVIAAMQTAFAVFTGASDPFLNGQGENFNPNRWGFVKDVNLDFDGQTRVVALRFLPTARLSGTVKNGQGVPIGARVRLTGVGPRPNGYPAMRIRGESNSDPALGTFAFNGQAFIGDYGLQAASPFFPVVVSTAGRTTQVDPVVENILLQFPPVVETNGSLSGQVLLPDGTPAGGDIRIQIDFGSDFFIRTGPDGRFATSPGTFTLPARGYNVTALDEATGATGRSSVGVTAGQDNQVTVRLLPRAAAVVQVLKADGSPAAGAEVEIMGSDFPFERFEATAAANGQAAFANLFEGRYAVCAALTIGGTRVAGRTALTVGPTGGSATLTLGGVATVRGIFVATDGVTPIPFANINLAGLAVSPTGADGRFVLADVPLGTHRIAATDDQTGRTGFLTVSLTADGQVSDVVIVQTPLGTINGFVIKSSGTGGVGGARVDLTLDDPFAVPRNRTVTTAPDGSFSFAGVPPGNLSLRAVDPVTQLSGDVRGAMPSGAAVLDVNIPITPTADLVVTVLESDGITPHPVVTVTVGNRSVDTGADGTARFDGLRVGSPQVVTAVSQRAGSTRDFAAARYTPEVQGALGRLTLIMRGTGTVSGTVFRGDGTTPAAGAQVVLTISPIQELAAHPVAGQSETVIAGADGRFTFTNIPVGPLKLAAFSQTQAAQAAVEFTSPGGNLTQNLILSASGTVAGRIVRADGTTPAAGADVTIRFASASSAVGGIVARSGADGRFSFNPVAVGAFTVESTLIEANGLTRFTGSLTANGETFDTGDLVLDEQFPAVVSVDPPDGSETADINAPVTILFSEPLDPASLRNSGIFLRPAAGGAAVPAALQLVAPDGETALRRVRLQPAAPLVSNTSYQLVVVDGDLLDALGAVTASGPRDLVGRPLTALFTSTFTTRDQRPPALLSFTPANNSEQVDPAAAIRVSFDEPIQPGATITLTGPSGPVAGTIGLGVNSLVLTFLPNVLLPPNATFTATIDNVRDIAGNALAGQPLVSTFTTLDTIGPDIAQLRLKNNPPPIAGTGVTLEAVLDEAEPGVRVRFTANFAPLATTEPDVLEQAVTLPASGSVVYRAIAIDRFGNEGPVAELSIAVLANQPPQLTFTRLSPADGPVPSGGTFSVRVNATDDSGVADLRAAAAGAAVVPLRTSTGAPVFVQGSVPATAVPGSRITILASATDNSGASTGEQTLQLDVSDGTAPAVAIASPAAGATVDAGSPLVVTGSTADNSGAVTLTFEAAGALSAPAQTFNVSGAPNAPLQQAASFDLSGIPLSGGTITMTVTARDAAGLSQAVTRNFVVPDRQGPVFGGFSYFNDPARAPLWSGNEVWCRFDDLMDPAQFAPPLVTLTDAGGNPVPFTIVVHGLHLHRMIVPAPPLRPGTTFTARVRPGLTDAAGNPWVLPGNVPPPPEGVSLEFTTAAITGVTPPAATKIIPGQSIPVRVDYQSGIGAEQWKFGFNGEVIATVAAGATSTAASIRLPIEAAAAVLQVRGAAGGLPDYLHPDILLDLRPRDGDDDSDGWNNGFEADRGMPPFTANADGEDFDNDGLTNGAERTAGTDPSKPDTDNDGLTDAQEITRGTNPLEPDTDGDGLTDAVDPFPLLFNRAPLAGNDAFLLAAGESLTMSIAGDLLANDSDPDGDALEFTGFTQPATGGAVTRPESSTLVFTPAAGFTGSASFQYTIRDAGALTATATVTITVGENTRPVAGRYGPGASLHALEFDGADDFVQVALDAGQDVTQMPAWTIEAWVRPSSFTNKSFPTIYSQGLWRASLGLQSTSGKLDSWLNNGSQMLSASPLELNQWTHVAVVHTGTQRRLYINGLPAGVQNSALPTADGFPIRLGAAGNASLRTDSPFQGRMDEVKVWSRALTDADIAAAVSGAAPSEPVGLAADWAMEEGNGTTTADRVSAARSGVFGNGTASQRPAWVASDAPARGFRQQLTVPAGQAALHQLEASDPDGQSLTATILSLPARGSLFQYAGGAAGAAINSVQTVVTDARRRVIYVPETGFSGVDGWRFRVSDGFIDSFPAVIKLNVVNDLALSAADVWDQSEGATITASSPVAGGSSAGNAFDGSAAALQFAGGAPAGFTHFIEWQTPGTVIVEAARLFASDGGVAGQGFSRMRLFGRRSGADPFTPLAAYEVPDNPYFGGEVRAAVLVDAFVGTQFRVEFDAAVPGSGPSLTELDAVGEPVVMVPTEASIALQNATADRSQSGFPVGGLIDGVINSSGWAGDVGGTPAMTAVFETLTNIVADANTRFTFVLPQPFGGSHFLGNFRISATTDARADFADGLANGGDITANWTVLEVLDVTSTGGETIQVLPDGSVLVGGAMPATTSYTVRARGITGAVTGFRLEMLEHPSLPNNGPGRVGHGNWVLAEFIAGFDGGPPEPNRAPRGNPDAVATTQGIPLLVSPLANDTDPEGDAMTIASFTQPPAGEGVVSAQGSTALRYQPPPGFSGTTTFSYRPDDGFQSGSPTLVTVTVRPTLERRWINPAGGNWSNGANWQGGIVPSADDIAIIDEPGTYQVNVDVNTSISQLRLGAADGTQTLNLNTSRTLTVLHGGSSQPGGRLVLNAGTFSAGAPVSLARLDMGGGTLTGAGDLTVTGAFNWTSGTLAEGGKLVLPAGSASTWTGGGNKGINRVVENTGTVTYSGTALFFNLFANSTGRLDNLAGGTLIFDGDGDVQPNFGGTNAINNAGLIVRRGPGTTTINSLPLNNTATVRIEAGVLELRSGGLLGTMESAGGTLALTGGTYTLGSGALLAQSALTLSSTTLNITDAAAVGFTSLTATNSTVQTAVDLTFSSLTLNETIITGAGNVTVTDTFNWLSGTLATGGKLILPAGSVSAWTGAGNKGINRVVENSGMVTYSGTALFFNLFANSTGRLENLAGGTLIIDGDGDVQQNFGGTNAINNAGTIIRRGAGTTFLSGLPLNNSGAVRIEAGVLELRSGGLLGIMESAGGTLTLTGGTYTLGTGALLTQPALTLSSTTLNITDAAAVGFSSLTGTNSTIQIGADLTLTSLTLNETSITGPGNLTVSDAFSWLSGTLAQGGKLILAPGSVSAWTGAGNKGINRVVENRGTVTYNGSAWFFNLFASSTGRLDNLAGGTLIFDGDGDVQHNFGGTNAINNAGLIIRRGAGTTTVNSLPLVSTGTVRIEAGVLELPVSTTLGGTWERAGGALILRNATFNVPPDAVFIPSALTASDATFQFPDNYSLESLTLNQTSLAGAGDVTVTGTFNWTGGVLAAGGKLILPAGSTSSWTGSGNKGINRVVENSGTVTYSGTNWFFNLFANSTGRLDNLAGGTLIFDGDGDVQHNFGGTNAINNAGLIIRRGAGTTTITSLPLNSTGTVRIEAGALELPVSTTLGGTWERAGGALTLRNATFTVPPDAVFIPSALAASDATFQFPGNYSLENLTLNQTSVTGAGDVTVTGTFNWTGGTLAAGGKLILPAGSTSSWTGSGNKGINRVVENSGTVTYNGISWLFNLFANSTGRLENLVGGTLIFDGDGDVQHNFGGTNTINNAGLIIRRGAGTTTISSLPLNNTGTVRIESGALQPAGGFTQSGILSGAGTFTGNLTNGGILRPDPLPGTGLTIAGSLTQTAAGRIELTLAGRDPSLVHRSLTVTGAAALNGTLALALRAPFDEEVDEAMEVIRFASRTGDFTATEGLTANFGYDFSRTFTGTALQLTVTTAGEVPAGPAGLALPVDPLALAAMAITDSDGDGTSDLLELAFGCDPEDATSLHCPAAQLHRAGIDDFPVLRFWQRTDGTPLEYVVEYGHDLGGWEEADGQDGRASVIEMERAPACAVADEVTVRLSRPLRKDAPTFLRVRVNLR